MYLFLLVLLNGVHYASGTKRCSKILPDFFFCYVSLAVHEKQDFPYSVIKKVFSFLRSPVSSDFRLHFLEFYLEIPIMKNRTVHKKVSEMLPKLKRAINV